MRTPGGSLCRVDEKTYCLWRDMLIPPPVRISLGSPREWLRSLDAYTLWAFNPQHVHARRTADS